MKIPFLLRVIVLSMAFLAHGSVDTDNEEIISLNESQYCFVNQSTIRVSDNFTSELQDIINKTEHVIISTKINSTVIFIAPSNGMRCSSERDYVTKRLFISLMVILVITFLVVVANITLHLMFKELHTVAGVLVIIMCGTAIAVTIISSSYLIYGFIINTGNEKPTACVVLTSMLYYVIEVYLSTKLVILFQFAYLMYKSYRLQSQDTIDKRCLLFKYVIFVLVSSIVCFLSAVLIDLAVNGMVYSNRDSFCIVEHFNLNEASAFRIVSIVQFALFFIVQIIVFIIGFTLYIRVNKSCCKTISTNFRIAVALATTIGLSVILLIILHRTRVSPDNTLPTVGISAMTEQILLFVLVISSRKVRNGLRMMLANRKRNSALAIKSSNFMKDHNMVEFKTNFK